MKNNALKNDILETLEKLNKGKKPKLTKKQNKRAEQRINKKMEEFQIKHNAYLAQSIESARHSYITC
jgi:hypothetical protein